MSMSQQSAFYEERESTIKKMLQEEGRITVSEVCDTLNISASTARILLQKMHDKGLIIRTHGGAVKADFPNTSDSLSSISPGIIDNISNYDKKMQIALAAKETVKDGDFIAISSGTTGLLFASLLTDFEELTVVTDSIPVANLFMFYPSIRVYVCGGEIRKRNGACFGPTAEEFLKSLKVDKAYSGCDSVDPNYGITSLDLDPRTEKYLCLCGNTKYILADSTKFCIKPFIEKTLDLKQVDYIISDASLDRSITESLEASGVKVLLGK